MGLDWTNIENRFPVFRENESPAETIKKLHDYLYLLMNELKYTLQNLDTENWNDKALEKFSFETTKDVGEELSKVAVRLNAMATSVGNISAQLSGLANRVTDVETECSYLQDRADLSDERIKELEMDTAQHRMDLDSLADELAGVEDLREQLKELNVVLDRILDAVKVGEESAVIGEAGKPLYLEGEIYINGVLYEQGGA